MTEIPVHVTVLHESEIPIGRNDPMAQAHVSLDMWLQMQTGEVMRRAARWRYVWPARSRRLTRQAQEYGRRAIEAMRLREKCLGIVRCDRDPAGFAGDTILGEMERVQQDWREGNVWDG